MISFLVLRSVNFNPRSDERSDCRTKLTRFELPNFNPRSDERSDENNVYSVSAYFISIHAPTNGATRAAEEVAPGAQISIHAPTNGATNTMVCLSGLMIFQSTLRRTERQELVLYDCF